MMAKINWKKFFIAAGFLYAVYLAVIWSLARISTQPNVATPLVEKTNTEKSTSETAAKKGASFDNKPFDLSARSLPSYYTGHDLAKLYDQLLGIDLIEKGEFETTEDYQRRKKVEESKPLIGNLTSDSIFAFSSEVESTSYDADKQILRVEIGLNP